MPGTYAEYSDAAAFLAYAGATLEREECANSLMLGVCLRLVDEPLAYGSQPYLATVAAEGDLRALAVMTPPYWLQLWTGEEPDMEAIERVADGLLEGGWAVPGVHARQAAAAAFAACWREKTGCTSSLAQRMRLYELRRVLHPSYPSGLARPAEAADLDLVRRWAHGFHDECFEDTEHARSVRGAENSVAAGRMVLWVDGSPKAMAARMRPTPHGESVGFVYTPPDQRGRGYGTAIAAHVSQRILDDGKAFCSLFADLENPTSNSIYQRLGYRPVADVVALDFGGP